MVIVTLLCFIFIFDIQYFKSTFPPIISLITAFSLLGLRSFLINNNICDLSLKYAVQLIQCNFKLSGYQIRLTYDNNIECTFNELEEFVLNTVEGNIIDKYKYNSINNRTILVNLYINHFSNLNIKKLEIFFDPNLNFVKELKLRGVPTTVIINKKGEEFARIIGSIDFKDKKFLKWLSNYD